MINTENKMSATGKVLFSLVFSIVPVVEGSWLDCTDCHSVLAVQSKGTQQEFKNLTSAPQSERSNKKNAIC